MCPPRTFLSRLSCSLGHPLFVLSSPPYLPLPIHSLFASYLSPGNRARRIPCCSEARLRRIM
jgi:hypothetical protein